MLSLPRTIASDTLEWFLQQVFPSFGEVVQPRRDVILFEDVYIFVCILVFRVRESRYTEIWKMLSEL